MATGNDSGPDSYRRLGSNLDNGWLGTSEIAFYERGRPRGERRQPGPIVAWCEGMLSEHPLYTREHFEDLPEIRDWKWQGA